MLGVAYGATRGLKSVVHQQQIMVDIIRRADRFRDDVAVQPKRSDNFLDISIALSGLPRGRRYVR